MKDMFNEVVRGKEVWRFGGSANKLSKKINCHSEDAVRRIFLCLGFAEILRLCGNVLLTATPASAPQDDKNAIPPTSILLKFCPNGNTPLLTSPIKGRKCAFTLAETLITLVIIGVVAALTVPTMIVKYQKEQTVTRLKKAYSALAQTTARAIADNGPMKTWEIGEDGTGEAAKNFTFKYLLPYLNVMRDCGTKNENQCRFDYSYLNESEIHTLNDSWERFILNDGTLMATYCVNNENWKRFHIMIDLNGQKKPNKIGKDVFRYNYTIKQFETTEGKITPDSIEYTRERLIEPIGSGCTKDAPLNAGMRCAALIMKDGWRIADDYPW